MHSLCVSVRCVQNNNLFNSSSSSIAEAFSPYKEIPDYPLGCEVILTIPNPEPERFYEGILRWIGSHDGYFWGVVQLVSEV